ncbi:ATP synthase D chain [Perilla frutescens var. hirtella]|nr:ATP synthase D chain [Perilla frutescens var. hirtella]
MAKLLISEEARREFATLRHAFDEVNTQLITRFSQHVAEILYENQLVVERKGVGHGTVTYLDKIKLLQLNLLAAHTVWVNEHELSRAGVKVLHCPAATMRMLGFASIKEMINTGAKWTVIREDWENAIRIPLGAIPAGFQIEYYTPLSIGYCCTTFEVSIILARNRQLKSRVPRKRACLRQVLAFQHYRIQAHHMCEYGIVLCLRSIVDAT